MAQLFDLSESLTSGPQALVLPGRGYSWQAPLLAWTIDILLEEGWRVRALSWDEAADGPDSMPGIVERALDDACHELGSDPDLLVAKSMSSLASPRAVESGIPGIWWTPLLHIPSVAEALSQADARHLLLGGTADSTWKVQGFSTAGAIVEGFEDADHSFRLPGRSWSEALALQSRALDIVERHVQSLGESIATP